MALEDPLHVQLIQPSHLTQAGTEVQREEMTIPLASSREVEQNQILSHPLTHLYLLCSD